MHFQVDSSGAFCKISEYFRWATRPCSLPPLVFRSRLYVWCLCHLSTSNELLVMVTKWFSFAYKDIVARLLVWNRPIRIAAKLWASNIIKAKTRVEICRDHHDRRSCKICPSCVKFPGKQRNFLHNLRRTSKFTHTKCDFALKLLKFYTLNWFLIKDLLR